MSAAVIVMAEEHGQRRAQLALGIATLLLAVFAPPLARVALSFGSPEYFSLLVLGTLAGVLYPRALVRARLQAPRSLWDPSYDERSWVNEVIGESFLAAGRAGAA